MTRLLHWPSLANVVTNVASGTNAPTFAACQKICQARLGQGGSRPTTPNHFVPRPYPSYVPSPTNGWVVPDNIDTKVANIGPFQLCPRHSWSASFAREQQLSGKAESSSPSNYILCQIFMLIYLQAGSPHHMAPHQNSFVSKVGSVSTLNFNFHLSTHPTDV